MVDGWSRDTFRPMATWPKRTNGLSRSGEIGVRIMRFGLKILVGIAFIFATAAFFLTDDIPYWSSGKYVVLASDDGPTLYGITDSGGLIVRVRGPVVAIGSDMKWVSVAQRADGDESTKFWIIIRSEDQQYYNAEDFVQGPLDTVAFDAISEKISVPKPDSLNARWKYLWRRYFGESLQ